MSTPLLNPVMRRSHSERTLRLTLGAAFVVFGCGTSNQAHSEATAGSAGLSAAQAGAPASGGSTSSGGESAGTGGAVTPLVAGSGGSGAATGGSGSGGAGAAPNGGVESGGGGASAGSSAAVGNAGAHSGTGGAGGSATLPPHTGTWRISPLGDSITGSTCGPQLLSKALIDHGKTNFTFVGSNLNNQSCNGAANVQTEGHGGYLVTDLVGSGMHASELPKWCDSNKADLVLMQFGTNDVWNDRSPSTILAAYATVLDDLRTANSNVVVLVAQITPLNPSGCSACESRVVALNAQIPAWAASKSTTASPVLVVDLHSAFTAASYTPNSTYTSDGVHPNVAGAQLIANKWYEALLALGAP